MTEEEMNNAIQAQVTIIECQTGKKLSEAEVNIPMMMEIRAGISPFRNP